MKHKRQHTKSMPCPRTNSKKAEGGRTHRSKELSIAHLMWLDLQRSLGNHNTETLLRANQLKSIYPGASAQIHRQLSEEVSNATAKHVPVLDPTRLGLEGELPGHANRGNTQPAIDAKGVPAHPQPTVGGTGVEVILSPLPPEVDQSKSAAQIAAIHGKPGVAGWATPHYQIVVSDVQPFLIDVDVILQHKIELAKEYKGPALQVLRDHEQGHVKIGIEKAWQHLVSDLKGCLEGLPGFTNPRLIQQCFRNAVYQFGIEEDKESRAYDAFDYPRMRLAYLGALTPLTDLEQMAISMAATATALRNFLALQPPLGKKRLPLTSQAAIDACNALGENEKAILQYNPEFKRLVDQAIANIGIWNLWLDLKDSSYAITGENLEILTIVLDGFDWEPPV